MSHHHFPSTQEFKCMPRQRKRGEQAPCMLPPLLGSEDFRILVTGSRKWVDWDAMQDAFDTFDLWLKEHHPKDRIVLVHGAAAGADKMAATMGPARYGWVPEPHPALWSIYGKKAGSKRNQHMVNLDADICFAFPMPDSIGTKDCMRRATRAQIHVQVVEPWHDLVRLGKKGLTDPPRLGEKT